MYDFETLLKELLQSRPELTREEALRRIEEKKRTVGAGYLTDQGALFLVAGELGVSLRRDDASADLSLKDLYIGANDITTVARILGVYPEATFNKRAGGTGRYKRFVLFDGKDSVRLTVWEEGLEQVGGLGLGVDTPVRVSNGYVKQGLDGKPNLNLGKRGKIEVLTESAIVANLPSISARVRKLPELTKEEPFIALDCVVTLEPRYSEFVRSDGSEGSLFQFGVAGEGGKETRVVIWSPAARPELKRGQRIRVVNVKSRRSNNGGFEVHGDAGSTILLDFPSERVGLRVVGVTSSQSAKMLLCLGRDKKVRFVEVGREAREPARDDVIGVVPDETGDRRLLCRTPDSIRILNGSDFPSTDELATKLQGAKEEDAQIMVEVIALSNGTVDDVKLRDGNSVKKGELMVGDDTGEVKIVAWRELSGRVSGIQPGERLRLVGVVPKSTKMGGWVLQLSGLSMVERLRAGV